jgi:glycerophosphoryl diester phosphodiesterase
MHIWQQAPAGQPLVIAHRGGALLGPENTAVAIAAAVANGADAVEVDVRRTSDGHLICFHDPDLGRIAGVGSRIGALSLDEIRALCPDLMTLRDAVDASCGIGLLLDVKLMEADALDAILAQIAPANTRTLLGLRSVALIAQARKLDPGIDILAFLTDPDSSVEARAAGATWFRLWQQAATPARLAAVRAAGLRPAIMVGQPRSTPDDATWPPFPVGVIDAAGVSELLMLGPDAILLDDPRFVSRVAPRRCHPAVVGSR